jgi:hypothetical protein
MRIHDMKLAFPVVDRDIEQCAIIEIIAVVSRMEIVNGTSIISLSLTCFPVDLRR